MRARGVGVLFQSDNLIAHLTVRQNIDLAQRLASRTDHAYRDSLVTRLGLSARADARPGTLSGGEAARAGLAVALAAHPTVLLADEPTGELDDATEAGVLTLLRAQADEGCAVVIASHSAATTTAADRVLTLQDGRLSYE
jgi:putative ABC transport system ATP-binding protein